MIGCWLRRCISTCVFLLRPTVILEKTIRIPRSLSVKAASVLKGFLNKNPADRLGCHRDTGFLDIANHPFFKSIDWEMVCSSSSSGAQYYRGGLLHSPGARVSWWFRILRTQTWLSIRLLCSCSSLNKVCLTYLWRLRFFSFTYD